MKTQWKMLNDFKDVVNDRYQISNNGDVMDTLIPVILHKKIANKKYHPYYAVRLKHNDCRYEWVLVHQLVGYCFVKIPKEYRESTLTDSIVNNDLVPDHLDNNGLNNYYKNLEWKTRSANISDAFKMGYIDFSCDKHRDALITNDQVKQICNMLESGYDYNKIIEVMNFDNTHQIRTLLVRIKNGLAYTDIVSKYNIPNRVMYTKAQKDTIDNMKLIKDLISKGLNNYEIARIVWPNTDKLKSKSETVRLIRSNKIYSDY